MCKNLIKDYVEYLKDNPKGYWFKAKLFGWGWTPARWQGWAVLLVFVALIVLNAFRFDTYPKQEKPMEFIVETIVLVMILLMICYKTGEKPHWRWGFPKDKEKK